MENGKTGQGDEEMGVGKRQDMRQACGEIVEEEG